LCVVANSNTVHSLHLLLCIGLLLYIVFPACAVGYLVRVLIAG
jgi:hypothetical protein